VFTSGWQGEEDLIMKFNNKVRERRRYFEDEEE